MGRPHRVAPTLTTGVYVNSTSPATAAAVGRRLQAAAAGRCRCHMPLLFGSPCWGLCLVGPSTGKLENQEDSSC